MFKLNFQQFSVPTGVSRKNRQTGDARESFADMIFECERNPGKGTRYEDISK